MADQRTFCPSGPATRWLWAGLALACAWDASGWDWVVAQHMGNSEGFILRDHWALTTVLHSGARALGWGLLLLLTVTAVRPWGAWRLLSVRERAAAVAGVWWALLAVTLLKGLSQTSCPWDLSDFGGAWPPVSHWGWGQQNPGPGHCFPAGHASTGFAFWALVPWLQPHSTAWARRWLWGALVSGAVLGLAQQLRGAHFTSHTLWTAWLCWAVGVGWWHGAHRWAHQRKDKIYS